MVELVDTDDDVTVDDDCWIVGLSGAVLSGRLDGSMGCVTEPILDCVGVIAVSCAAYAAIPAKTSPMIVIERVLDVNSRQSTGWLGHVQ